MQALLEVFPLGDYNLETSRAQGYPSRKQNSCPWNVGPNRRDAVPICMLPFLEPYSLAVGG